jgi:hypothetical protein
MNILEIEDIIKGLPDQSLIQEAQAPSGQMPQFLVVSEIQRRADMRKRFQNQQQEMPQGTIADQILQGGIASMGNRQPIQSMPPQGMPQQGMPPQGMPPMPPQGMPMQQQPPMMPPMSPPMMPPAQGMAAGGVVRMREGEDVPYTGGTERPELRTGASYIYRDSIFNPEAYEPIDPVQRREERKAALADRDKQAEGTMAQEEQQRQERLDTFTRNLLVDNRLDSQIKNRPDAVLGGLSVEFNPQNATDSQGSATLSFGDNYNVENPLDMDPKRFYETTINKDPKYLAPIISLGLSDRTPKDKVDEDMMKRPEGPDYSAAKSILDELQAVDYSAFKPDYAGLITEQERRAQKIRDDASKDASAQALIQLGAGLAAGDISKGLSAAGQSVADIKRQARAEARDEEGFARQLRLAQDEAGMQIGLKQAEAERSIQLEMVGLSKGEADALANAEVRAYEFEQEFGLKESELAAGIRRDIMTSGKSSLSALIEQWKDLADAATEEDIAERNNLANQIKVLVEEQKFLRDELRGSLNADSSLNTGAAFLTPPGSGGFNLVSIRPGQ